MEFACEYKNIKVEDVADFLPIFLCHTFEQDVATDIENIQKAMGGGIDASFDCAGFNKTMSTALGATRPGGKVCLVGMGHHEMTVPLTPAAARYNNISYIYDILGLFKNFTEVCIRSSKIVHFKGSNTNATFRVE